MSEWSITPTEGAHDNGNGNYTFTPPETGERKYTITYTDGDVSGSIEYVVKSTDCYVNPCKNNLTPPTVSPSTVANFSSDGGEIEATYNLDDCWDLITATTTNKVVDVTLTNPSIITVTSNTSTDEQVSVVTYKFRNEIANVTGESKVTITQKFDECINKPAPTVTFANGSTTTNVPAMGTDEERTAHVLVGTDTCWILESKEFVSPTPQNHAIFVGDDAIKVLSNETDYNVTVKAKYHFVNISDSSKTSDSFLEITQPIGCNCNSVSYTANTHISFNTTGVRIGEFNITDGCDYSKVYINFLSSPTIINPVTLSVFETTTSGKYAISAKTNENKTSEERTDRYKLTYNGKICDTEYYITQSPGCSCGSIQYVADTSVVEATSEETLFGRFTMDNDCDGSKVSVVKVLDNDGVIDWERISIERIAHSSPELYLIKAGVNENKTSQSKTFEYKLSYNGEDCGTVYSKTQAAGCECNCNNVVKILNEYGHIFYAYSGEEQLSNVPFAILSKNKNLDCDITANKASDTVSQTGIISIGCVKYTNSDTKWSSELKNYCNEKIDESPNDDLYIIYGDLGATVSQRALGFTYTVCGKECTDYDDSGNPIPYYVFQRCACGMDNCRNVYGDGSIIEDRPEFLMEYDCGWLQYDSICVETLSCMSASYYTRTFSTDADIYADIAVESAKDQVYTGPTVWIRKKTNDGTQLDTLNKDLKNDEISRHPEKVLVLHKDENNNDMLAISSTYMPSSPLPLKSGVYYIVNAPKKDMVEQVWEVKFATSSSRIIGGDDDGRCALSEFYATIYKAPAGWDYVKGDIDKNNKRRKRKCDDPNCGCKES